ncbi:Hypothetical predicted protein [Octopus vulgaris]|uniref:LRRCT domain-containing protein n=1 Tax=Octopus vulgaris TaxID=6645 RepID=A0AA36C0E1_OCTVU|nr:Hypothetical predicted protein [Octopus vulgaris]
MHLQLQVYGRVARTEPPNGGEEEDQVRRVRAVRDTLEEGSEYTMARWIHCEIRKSRRDLFYNKISTIRQGTFENLYSLRTLDLSGNNDMMCGCHLPAVVNYTRNTYNTFVDVKGECFTDSGEETSILKYWQCINYTLFQKNLQCEGFSGRRILGIIEVIPEMFSLEEQELTVLYSNLGIGATKVEKDTFNGVIYSVSYGTNETEARNEIYNDPNSLEEDMMDYISLPKSLIRHLTEEELTTFSRISFFNMKEDKLYRVIQTSNNQTTTKVDSRIIAANIPNVNITNLDEPVTISFNVIDQASD